MEIVLFKQPLFYDLQKCEMVQGMQPLETFFPNITFKRPWASPHNPHPSDPPHHLHHSHFKQSFQFLFMSQKHLPCQ